MTQIRTPETQLLIGIGDSLRQTQRRLENISRRYRNDENYRHAVDHDPKTARRECVAAGVAANLVPDDDRNAGVKFATDHPNVMNLVIPLNPNAELRDAHLEFRGGVEAGSLGSVGSAGSASTFSTGISCLGSASSAGSVGSASSVNP